MVTVALRIVFAAYRIEYELKFRQNRVLIDARFGARRLIMVQHAINSRQRSLAVMAILMLSFTGCRICSDTGDLDYPTYGGAWERTIRESGRVGSVFDPAGARASALVSRDQPITADELERGRRDEEERLNPSDPLPDPELEDSLDDEPDPSPDSSSDPEQDPNIEDIDPNEANPNEANPNEEGTDPTEPGSGRFDEEDPDLKRKMEELRKEELDVKIIPGNPLPPLLR